VVASPGGPESETVLRRAARIASGPAAAGRADLLCVHVLRRDGLPGPPRERWPRCAGWPTTWARPCHTVVGGERVPAACWTRPRGERHPLVLGTSRRSRWPGCFNPWGSAPPSCRTPASIDVHMSPTSRRDPAWRWLRGAYRRCDCR